MKLETFWKASVVQERFYPSHSVRWVKDTFCALDEHGKPAFGPVLRDAGGWLISETAVQEHQRVNAVGLVAVRADMRQNLKQFQDSKVAAS